METRRQKMFILNASKTQRAGGMSCRIGSVLLLFYSATNKPRPWHRFDFLPVNGRRRSRRSFEMSVNCRCGLMNGSLWTRPSRRLRH